MSPLLNPELVDDDVYMEMPEGMVAPAGGTMGLQAAQVIIRTKAGPQTMVRAH